MLPTNERCTAIKGNINDDSKRCTRRRQDGNIYCGTHIRNPPTHSVAESDSIPGESSGFKSVNVWVQDIKGIMYHIDHNNNVYHPEDVLRKINNPRIIGTWKHNEEQGYNIVLKVSSQ